MPIRRRSVLMCDTVECGTRPLVLLFDNCENQTGKDDALNRRRMIVSAGRYSVPFARIPDL
jgi:hypothetical protein